MIVAAEEYQAPSLEHLEDNAQLVTREVARLLARVAEHAGALQDLEAELAEDWSAPAAARHRWLLADLRRIARMLARAQLELVHPSDERAAAVPKVRGYLDEADRADAPWRDAA